MKKSLKRILLTTVAVIASSTISFIIQFYLSSSSIVSIIARSVLGCGGIAFLIAIAFYLINLEIERNNRILKKPLTILKILFVMLAISGILFISIENNIAIQIFLIISLALTITWGIYLNIKGYLI